MVTGMGTLKDQIYPGSRTGIAQLFDELAANYLQHAALEHEVASRLFARLIFQRRTPVCILDLGAGPGNETSELKRRYRKAEVIALDVSLSMCRLARRQSTLLHPVRSVCADLSSLPIADRTVDLIFSNFALHWHTDFPSLTGELRRVLRPDGLLLFSTPGPGSLRELQSALEALCQPSALHPLPDMRTLGDALLAAGFSEPVVDSEFITLEYRDLDLLLADLTATGASAHFRNLGLQNAEIDGFVQAYEPFRRGGVYPVTWEIVYGAAFGPGEGRAIKSPHGDVAAFSVDHLRKSLPRA